MRCWAVAAGAAMFTSEVCLALSLLTFNRGSLLSAAKHLSAPLRLRVGLRERLMNALVIAILYVPVGRCRKQWRQPALTSLPQPGTRLAWQPRELAGYSHVPRVHCPPSHRRCTSLPRWRS